MNNIKLLKAQAKLALSMIEPRALLGIENYISALESRIAELESKCVDVQGDDKCQCYKGLAIKPRMLNDICLECGKQRIAK